MGLNVSIDDSCKFPRTLHNGWTIEARLAMTVGGHEGWPAGGGRGAVPAGAMQNARQPQQVADVRYHHTDAQTVIMQIFYSPITW